MDTLKTWGSHWDGETSAGSTLSWSKRSFSEFYLATASTSNCVGVSFGHLTSHVNRIEQWWYDALNLGWALTVRVPKEQISSKFQISFMYLWAKVHSSDNWSSFNQIWSKTFCYPTNSVVAAFRKTEANSYKGTNADFRYRKWLVKWRLLLRGCTRRSELQVNVPWSHWQNQFQFSRICCKSTFTQIV